MNLLRTSSAAGLVYLCFISYVCAESISTGASFDRWMYPFNATPGTRITGSTFGAINNPAFDDHDAQILLGFDTSSGHPGLPASNYQIASAIITLTTATDGAFQYDPTYDPFATYVDASDADIGRPLELYGIGYRNGYIASSISDTVPGPTLFGETDAFSIPGPPASEARFAFASDYKDGSARDVSNNVRNATELSPWATGQTSAVAAGEQVPINTDIRFNIDLSNADVVSYLQDGLAEGELFFSVVSMHESVQGSAVGIPSFHLADANGMSTGSIARIDLEYSIVPEPGSTVYLIFAVIVLAAIRRRKP